MRVKTYERFQDRVQFKLHGSVSTFMDKSLKNIAERKTDLRRNRMMYFGKFSPYIMSACGFKPRLDVEKSLEHRIKNSRFKKYLQDNIVVSQQSYDRSLRKAMVALIARRKISISKPRLFAATVRVLQSFAHEGKLYKPTSVDFAMRLLNKRASAGYPFVGRKGKNYLEITSMAKDMIKTKLSGQYKYYPNLCAYRLQLRGSAPNIKVKTRIMYPFPGAITAVEQRYIFPILRHFARQKGQSFYTVGMQGRDLTKWLKGCGHRRRRNILSIDINAWDQNLPNEVMTCAFWVIRQCHVMDNDELAIFNEIMLHSICSYHACKYNGKAHLFIKDHGIPSGSSFTNMIGSICHAIIAEYIQKGILAEKRILICSDDNIFETDMSLKQISLAYLEFGLEISVDKSSVYTSWANVRFLGYNWIDYLRNVDISLTLNQMVTHSQFLVAMDQFDRELARSASILLAGKNGQDVFRELFPDVMLSLAEGKNVRFTYLYGYGPPTTNPAIMNKGDAKSKDRFTGSIRLHLQQGHLIT